MFLFVLDRVSGSGQWAEEEERERKIWCVRILEVAKKRRFRQ
nr:hypothetical protein Iba_chr14aCG26670 [Ipomoea batatas]